jgi:simple sugar transport system ATP-binding protein
MELKLNQISKRFGPNLANDGISLTVNSGEVLALLGENGAGKSTLMRIVYGLYRPDLGKIEIDGKQVHFKSPAEARAAGIGMVFQELNLIPAMTAKENLLLASPDGGWRLSRQSTKTAIRRFLELAPQVRIDRPVADLAIGEKQLLELAKVLNAEAKLIILDEPTSVLTPTEVERLYQRIQALAQAGRSIIMISHKLDDVLACASRVAVLRRGRLVYEGKVAESSRKLLIEHFIGEERLRESKPAKKSSSQASQLEVVKLSGKRAHSKIFDVTFSVAKGEILGIAGVSGNGQQLLADLISGVEKPTSGRISIGGKTSRSGGKILAGTGYIPEFTAANAVAPNLDLKTNLEVKRLRKLPLLNPLSRSDQARSAIERFNVQPADPRLPAKMLSGGNLQKLVLARELGVQRDLVVACYPTMGLDLAASQEVRAKLVKQAENGAAVVWISEDLDELLSCSDELAVLFGGRIVGVVRTAEVDRAQIGNWMAGLS